MLLKLADDFLVSLLVVERFEGRLLQVGDLIGATRYPPDLGLEDNTLLHKIGEADGIGLAFEIQRGAIMPCRGRRKS